MRAAALLAAATVWLVQPGQAMAQETRAETIRQEQADKQSTVTPPTLNRAEKIIDRLEDWGLITGEPRGVYPLFGSVYPGGGFAAGVGARKAFGDDGAVNVFGGYSINRFWRAQADLSLPTFAPNRGADYALGPLPRCAGCEVLRRRGRIRSKDDKTRFGYTPVTGGARLDIEVSRKFTLGGGVDYTTSTTSAGHRRHRSRSGSRPPIPGARARPNSSYINSTARAAFDWRRRLGYTGSGGLVARRSSTISASATTTCIRSSRSREKSCSSFRSCAQTG